MKFERREENLGEARAEAEPYILVIRPTTERRRAQRGTKCSGVSSKYFRFYIYFDRLSINFFNASSLASLS